MTRLELENETLSRQVKNLIKAESKLYEYQEQLDTQLHEYKTLYELNRKISSTFDLRKIFEAAIEYAIHNLEYERVIFFQQSEITGDYVVCALDGFYDPEEKKTVAQLTLKGDDPSLLSFRTGCEFLIGKVDAEDPQGYRARLLMQEFLIYPLGPQGTPPALIAVGNSAENAPFYRRINDAEDTLLGMGNLVGMLSSRVENYLFFSNMEKALEQEKQAEAKYRGIFENAAEGIIQVTRDGRLLSCNPAAAAILGYESPEEMTRRITDIGHQVYVQPELRDKLYDRLGKGRAVTNFDLEFYRKDGSRRWVQLSVRPVFNEHGEILYADGMILDIAERKRAEKALQDVNDELEQRVIARTSELEQANRGLRQLTSDLETAFQELKNAQSRVLQQEKMASIGQLAAGVAHEINNPMGFIISNLNSFNKYTEKITTFLKFQAEAVEALVSGSDSREITENLEKQKKLLKLDYVLEDLGSLINESMEGAERVRRIVQNLKSFSRLDESEFKMAEINGGIESTINMVWNEIKYKANLNRDYGDIPQTYCNLGQLNQVFMNLLINASQAIETRGEITVKTSSDDKNLFITISDTGTGIPADKLPRIFEPFFTTKAVGKGTGLGLSIAYDIVKKHNGEIKVESEVGRGTTFMISLPIMGQPSPLP